MSAKIIRGLREAIRHAKGESTGSRATVYRVRRLGERAVVETKGQPPRIFKVKP